MVPMCLVALLKNLIVVLSAFNHAFSWGITWQTFASAKKDVENRDYILAIERPMCTVCVDVARYTYHRPRRTTKPHFYPFGRAWSATGTIGTVFTGSSPAFLEGLACAQGVTCPVTVQLLPTPSCIESSILCGPVHSRFGSSILDLYPFSFRGQV